METSISTFCKSLASFCNHLQTNSQALSESIQRRPIPLDSAASAFLQCLDRRVSSTSTDLNLLESMAFGTVSFEELLGHCSEVYKMNQNYIVDLEEHMMSFGYVPEIEMDDDDSGLDSKFLSPRTGLDRLPFTCGSVSAARSSKKILEDDPLFEDSISLRNLGLSDACLATLASEDRDYPVSPTISSHSLMSDDGHVQENIMAFQPPTDVFDTTGDTKTMIKTSKDDYDKLPSYMKSLASWEDLYEAVVKMNSYLYSKDKAKGSDAFTQDEVETLGLGRKGRTFLLLLLRMNRVVLETVDGSVVYRVLVDCS